MLDRIRAAMTPRWSREMVFAALLSVWLVDLTSSREETFKGTRIKCLLQITRKASYHISAGEAEKKTSCRPLGPIQYSKKVRDQVVEDSAIFSFVGILCSLCFAGPG
jgi:hypothetical protein